MEQAVKLSLLGTTADYATNAEIIIEILCSEYPLTLRSLHYRVTKKQGKKTSMQSVFKAAKKLCKNNVLVKTNSMYYINLGWLDEMEAFTNSVRRNYLEQKTNQLVDFC